VDADRQTGLPLARAAAVTLSRTLGTVEKNSPRGQGGEGGGGGRGGARTRAESHAWHCASALKRSGGGDA